MTPERKRLIWTLILIVFFFANLVVMAILVLGLLIKR